MSLDPATAPSRSPSPVPTTLWTPTPASAEQSEMGRFRAALRQRFGSSFAPDYPDLWRWSVQDVEEFWRSLWAYLDPIATGDPTRVMAARAMPGTTWFPDVALNYAEQILGTDKAPALRHPDSVALLGRSQTRADVDLTWAELRDQVQHVRAGLRRLGVGKGDRVVAYLPNIPETVVAFLATASLGAIWSSCAPEFGVPAVVDRLGQITPKVLLAVDGYRYGARTFDHRDDVAAIRRGLGDPVTVTVPYLFAAERSTSRGSGEYQWDDLASRGETEALAFTRVAFDHPLYVLYSSGTTGLPKAIVHGHGGIVLEHVKTVGLHLDLGVDDRLFWFTTTGWMMWNFAVSALLRGCSMVCFDGDPLAPDLGELWRIADRTRATYLGLSAPYLVSCRKAGVVPKDLADVTRLRGVGSTGAPLPTEGFEWVYEAVGSHQQLCSISGGTDVCTALVGSSPLSPVWAGEISCRWLGVAADAFDESGAPVPEGVEGELVVTEPMPSMPVGFWGDDDGERYRASYFERFPGVWAHGDWVTFTARGSCVVSGRSDATLNRGGVRLGTAEFYGVVEAIDGIDDSLIVHLPDPGGGPGELVLFVVLGAPRRLDDELEARITGELRRALSPRHAPDRIWQVPVIPRTLSGKKLEIPVKRVLLGRRPEDVASLDSLVDPSSLHPFVAFAARLSSGSGSGRV
jgi:acetoacetyl-CoA synthetase